MTGEEDPGPPLETMEEFFDSRPASPHRLKLLSAYDFPDVTERLEQIFNLDDPPLVTLSGPPGLPCRLAEDDVAMYVWQESMREDGSCFVIVRNPDEQLIGTIAYLNPAVNLDAAWVGLILISRPYRRKGYGAEVMRMVHDRIAAAGHKTVGCYVEPYQAASKTFWTGLGYVESRATEDDAGRPVIEFRKPLT